MVDYENCKECDCFDPDLGVVKPSSQIVNACDLCEMTEELWREFAESCER